jgi:hypothetical protein
METLATGQYDPDYGRGRIRRYSNRHDGAHAEDAPDAVGPCSILPDEMNLLRLLALARTMSLSRLRRRLRSGRRLSSISSAASSCVR